MIKKVKTILKNNIKEYKWTYITFLVASIIISVIYTLCKIKPFGNNSMLDVDFYHQYGPLLNELRDRISEGKSLLYSFNTGGGIPFYRNFLNYLSSPFNFILFLVKKENVVMAFSIIIGVKAIFAATNFSIFLKKVFKRSNILSCIFSLFYAFSGYFCAYYWNIMWLDGIVFLPLIAYGIVKLVDEEKPLVYCIFLSIMLFANYFIAYMICIFSVLFFLGYFLYKGNIKLKNIVRKFAMFGIFSLLAAGLSCFALLPLYNSLSSISATTDSFPEADITINALDYLFNHIPFVTRTVFASDELPLPNIYCGILTLVCSLLFFVNKKIDEKAKIIALIAILFFYLSFSFNDLDFIWHAFHVPNDLPYRYSFIYVFILSTIGYIGASRIKELSKLKVSICFGIIILFVLLAIKLSFENLTDTKAIVCMIIILCYYLVYIISDYKKMPKFVISIFLIIISLIECSYGIVVNWNIDHDIDTFMSSKEPVTNLINKVTKDDNGLYRIEKTSYLTLNDPAWFNYKGISTFSSMAYESVSKFQRNIGLSGNTINSYYYKDTQTPVYNTMFNIKYLIGDYTLNDYYKIIDKEDNYNLIKYNYSSSIAYGVSSEIKNWSVYEGNPFKYQSEFTQFVTGKDDVYEPLSIKEVKNATLNGNIAEEKTNGEFYYDNVLSKEIVFILDNPKSQNIYLYINGSDIESFKIDGKYYSITSDEFYTLDIGKKEKGNVEIQINLKSTNNNYLKFYAYSLNEDTFKEYFQNINNEKLNVEKYSDTYIYGKLDASKDETVFTSIAYDKGFKVYVDDKLVKTFKIADSYMGFDVKKGSHKIRIEYYPVNLKLGVIISFISLIIIWLYYIFFQNNKRKLKKITKR